MPAPEMTELAPGLIHCPITPFDDDNEVGLGVASWAALDGPGFQDARVALLRYAIVVGVA